jgi:cell division protease FtsH
VNNQRWRKAGQYLVLAIGAIILSIVTTAVATVFLEKPAPAQKTLEYSQFIQEVKQGKIEHVGLSADRSRALIQSTDGRKAIVKLPPNDNQFTSILTNNVKGKIYVLPQNDESIWLRVLMSLFLPVFLMVGFFSVLVGLYFFLQRSD